MKKNKKAPMGHVRYIGDLRCASMHLKSGQVVESDAPIDNHGKGMKFSPTDLLSTSLAKCMLTVMGIKANSMKKVLDGSQGHVYKTMASEPRRVAKIRVDLHLTGDEFSPKEKKVLQKVAMTCPVSNSLHPDLVQEISFFWE